MTTQDKRVHVRYLIVMTLSINLQNVRPPLLIPVNHDDSGLMSYSNIISYRIVACVDSRSGTAHVFSLPALVLLVAAAHSLRRSSPLMHFTSSVFQFFFIIGLPVYVSEHSIVIY